MAKHLDLEEQEQLDQIKHFWAKYGNAISWVLIAVFGSFAAWNGWNYWQRQQAARAGALYEEIDRAAQAKDLARVERALADIQKEYGSTPFAAQGALLAGKALLDGGETAKARAALDWTVTQAKDPAYQAIARLRRAALDLQAGQPDAALQALQAPVPASFEPLVADRRGDVLLSQGKTDEAKAQYEAAWKGMGTGTEYRRLVEVKLAALGVNVSGESR